MLCSKCKGICNENSENVGRKRKATDNVPPPSKRSANAPVTRSANSYRRRINNEANVIEKELPSALCGNVNKLNIVNNLKKPLVTVSNLNRTLKLKRQIEVNSHSVEHSECSSDYNEVSENGNKPKVVKRVLRKKRSVEAIEDAWDDANINNNVNTETPSACSSTRTIKISYGPQGEGTVLKIPAQIENVATDESEENSENSKMKKDSNNKAARKALKKAKKEARRKVLLGHSPSYSPRYTLSGSSPRYTVDGVSPRHGIGNNSPRYVSATGYELNVPRRRKHKMKHKKKHREDRKHKEGDVR